MQGALHRRCAPNFIKIAPILAALRTRAPQIAARLVHTGQHYDFARMGADAIRAFGKPASVLYDVKYVLPRDAVDGRL